MLHFNCILLFILIFNIPRKPFIHYCNGTPLKSDLTSTIKSYISLSKRDILDKNYKVNLTRQSNGDNFRVYGINECSLDACMDLSNGTAELFDDVKKTLDYQPDDDESCNCGCLPYSSTYREDLGMCVDDIRECPVSSFFSGSSSEKIPFVFLPLRGQIIYPSREINFKDILAPICAVTGSQYLTTNGWADLRNPTDLDFPFRMFRDQGRTFLQWLGEPDLRFKMQGRLILIHLMCRDMTFPITNITSDGQKNIFTPCVAFRVNGSPVKYVHNVSEVLFQSETTLNLSTTSDGLSAKEYIVIAACSLLLGLIYVASVFLYLHVKKRKNLPGGSQNGLDDLDIDINYPKNDQVTFGAPFSRTGSTYSTSRSINDTRNSQRSSTLNGSNEPKNSLIREEMGIVKNNPLLKHFANLSDHSGFASDLSNSNSDCEDSQNSKNERKHNQTSVMVHPKAANKNNLEYNSHLESPPSPTQDNERLPEENVTITEDIAQDVVQENMRALVSGTIRKKLYFNPAYFEPHLLMSPPPAAIEFLTKIREVIAIAKYKMATKRYQPSLNVILEESQNSDIYNKQSKSSENLSDSQNQAKCNNCGDKRNSIEKWLESVPVHQELKTDKKVIPENVKISPPKEKPPPIPKTAPKIISHSLKPHVEQIALHQDEINQALRKEKSITDVIALPIKESLISVKKRLDEIYTFAETGSEIYNNPKFNHIESPALSQKSRSSQNLKSRRKKIEVLDQYSNLQKDPYDILKCMKPDLVYEALAKDYSMQMHSRKQFNDNKNNSNNNYNIPTPDYDSTIDKKVKDIYNSTQGSVSSVPTPDYSSLGKKPLRQYQPDSPIYRRKSPQYLIVDYETDSLERTSTANRKCLPASSSSSPSSNNSSDVSSASQPSPSLSTALPLEEEVEIRHTVYDKVEGFRQDGDTNLRKKVTREYEDVNGIRTPRIKYDTPFRGSMTIEVEHEPLSDLEISTDSDQFEPDTLDRKKHSFCDIKAWSDHLKKSKNFVNSNDDKVSYSSLENMQSLPDFNDSHKNHYVLRSTNSFRDHVETPNLYDDVEKQDTKWPKLETKTSFGSLREIYQSKTINQRPKLASIDFRDQGRLLTLEAKHTKRQRNNIADEVFSKVMPPDVIPSNPKNLLNVTNYYDIPKIHNIQAKNLKGWNTNKFNGNENIEKYQKDADAEEETNSNHSESTEITGVSDTNKENSETDNISITMSDRNKNKYGAMDNNYKNFGNRNIDLSKDYSLNRYKMKKRSNADNFNYSNNNNNNIIKNNNNSNILEGNCANIQTVYHVEINTNSNGMQIAMGLKDRVKKSKDLKNAWKRFVSLATSKLNPKVDKDIETFEIDDNDKKTNLNYFEIDEGMSPSLVEDNNKLFRNDLVPRVSRPNLYEHRFGQQRQDLDSGYMSADSSEVYNRRCYDRYNFKIMSEGIDSVIEDCVNDDPIDIINETNSNKTVKTELNISKFKNDIVCFEPIQGNTCSSDEDKYSIQSSEDRTEDNLSESGAESVETHSVFFKTMPKNKENKEHYNKYK